MKLIRQPFSLDAKFDHVLLHEGMVAIVEIRKQGAKFYSVWWVAGLTEQQRLAVAYQGQFALNVSSPAEADSKVESAALGIFAIAKDSLSAGGVKPVPLLDSPELPKALATTFLNFFQSEGLFELQAMELNVSTGLQYEFCQLLKVSKPVEFLAAYLNVPVTTVRQRITWARNKGILPKLRNVGGENDAKES